MIDSETEGAQPLLYPEDWHSVRGDLYALHAGHAYAHGRLPLHHIESPPTGEQTAQPGKHIIDGDFLRQIEYNQYATTLRVMDLVRHAQDHPWAPPDLGTIDLSGEDVTMTQAPPATHRATRRKRRQADKEVKPPNSYKGGVRKTRKYIQPRLESIMKEWPPLEPTDAQDDMQTDTATQTPADPTGDAGAQCTRCGKADVKGRLGRLRKCQNPDGCSTHMHDWCTGLLTERGYCPDVWLCPDHTANYDAMGLPRHLTTDENGYYEYCQTCGGRGTRAKPLAICDEPGCYEAFHPRCVTGSGSTGSARSKAYCAAHIHGHGTRLLAALAREAGLGDANPTSQAPAGNLAQFLDTHWNWMRGKNGWIIPRKCTHPGAYKIIIEVSRDQAMPAVSTQKARGALGQTLAGRRPCRP